MTQALTTQAPGPLVAILSDVDRLKDLPIETVERLFALDREHRSEQARRSYNEAFHQLQSQMTPVRKAARNDQTRSTYARAEDVEKMLDPLLDAHGFSRSLSTAPCPIPDHIQFVLTVRHVGGHTEVHPLDAPIDDKGPKGAPVKTRLHGTASSMTFCGRLLLCNVFGVTLTNDDDGNAGGGLSPSNESITQDQADDLATLMQDVGADHYRFFKHFGIEKLEELPAGKLRQATAMLEAKQRRS